MPNKYFPTRWTTPHQNFSFLLVKLKDFIHAVVSSPKTWKHNNHPTDFTIFHQQTVKKHQLSELERRDQCLKSLRKHRPLRRIILRFWMTFNTMPRKLIRKIEDFPFQQDAKMSKVPLSSKKAKPQDQEYTTLILRKWWIVHAVGSPWPKTNDFSTLSKSKSHPWTRLWYQALDITKLSQPLVVKTKFSHKIGISILVRSSCLRRASHVGFKPSLREKYVKTILL